MLLGLTSFDCCRREWLQTTSTSDVFREAYSVCGTQHSKHLKTGHGLLRLHLLRFSCFAFGLALGSNSGDATSNDVFVLSSYALGGTRHGTMDCNVNIRAGPLVGNPTRWTRRHIQCKARNQSGPAAAALPELRLRPVNRAGSKRLVLELRRLVLRLGNCSTRVESSNDVQPPASRHRPSKPNLRAGQQVRWYV